MITFILCIHPPLIALKLIYLGKRVKNFDYELFWALVLARGTAFKLVCAEKNPKNPIQIKNVSVGPFQMFWNLG